MTLGSPAKEKEIKKHKAARQRNNLIRKLITYEHVKLPATLQLVLKRTKKAEFTSSQDWKPCSAIKLSGNIISGASASH